MAFHLLVFRDIKLVNLQVILLDRLIIPIISHSRILSLSSNSVSELSDIYSNDKTEKRLKFGKYNRYLLKKRSSLFEKFLQ